MNKGGGGGGHPLDDMEDGGCPKWKCPRGTALMWSRKEACLSTSGRGGGWGSLLVEMEALMQWSKLHTQVAL